jgi:hypothetical protein
MRIRFSPQAYAYLAYLFNVIQKILYDMIYINNIIINNLYNIKIKKKNEFYL